MPDAIITSTASTFGTISGTFAADQSTVTGTVTGIVTGTLSGSVGVPGPAGPAGPGVPAGGTAGQFLQKIDGTNYNTDWVTLNLSAYLTKAGNLSGLTDLATARDNLNLGTLNTPTFAGVTVQGAGANVANLTSTSLSLNHVTSGSFVIQPSAGITFPDTTIQTTAFNATAMLPYALINSQVFTGTPSLPAGTIGVTAALGDNDTSLATTAFVQQELLSGTANARNLEVYVRNQTGSTLAAGSIVYINGATGNRPTVTKAQANNDANSAQTMGFVKTAIANNGFGFVIVRGECENLDTQAVAEGTQLYLSPTVAGAYTTTKPVAPNHMVYVGIVIRSHPTQGVILVAVQNGLELEELHDVLITSPTNGQVLKYDSVSGLWVNGTDVGGVAWGGITGTLSSQTDLQTALDGKYSTTNPAGYITSSALTGYATETFVTSQGYITSAALSPYLTSATAASTYAALSGATFTGKVTTIASTTGTAPLNIPHGQFPTTPNDGDIWTTGGGIFSQVNGLPFQFAKVDSQTFSGTPSAPTATPGTSTTQIATTAFVTTADTLKANLASPTFTGVPAAPTAAVDTNTTQIATTAYVVGQGYAKLASPALTGTPTAPTATAGTNTTQIATTAFVTAALPAIATFAESQQLASTTKVMSPYDVLLAMMTEGYRPALGMTGGSSGTGAGVNPIMPQYMGIGGPNAGVAGSCHAITNNFGSFSTSAGSGNVINWNKPVCLSGTFSSFSSLPGDANNEFKLFLGPSMLNGNDPNAAAIGLWRRGGTSAISLMVHNGTTLTKVASAGTYSGSNPIRYLIYSDGAGNVTLYINGTQVATTALGPTSAATNVGQFTASILQNASAATKYYIELVHPKIFVAPQ